MVRTKFVLKSAGGKAPRKQLDSSPFCENNQQQGSQLAHAASTANNHYPAQVYKFQLTDQNQRTALIDPQFINEQTNPHIPPQSEQATAQTCADVNNLQNQQKREININSLVAVIDSQTIIIEEDNYSNQSYFLEESQYTPQFEAPPPPNEIVNPQNNIDSLYSPTNIENMSSNVPARRNSRSSSMTQDQITETKNINEKCQEREKKRKRKHMSKLFPIDDTPYQRNTNTPTISNNVMISEANHTQTPPQISQQSEKRITSNVPVRTSSRSSSMTQGQITETEKINEKCQEREKKRKRKHMSKLSPIDETPYQRNTNTPTISNNDMISEANHTQTPPQISQQSEKRMSSNVPAHTSSRSSSMTQDQITETKKIHEKCQEREKKRKRKHVSKLSPIDETPYQGNTNPPTISNNVMISEANHTQTPPQISQQSEKRMLSNVPARTSSRSSSMTQGQITETKKINEKCQEREKKRKQKHMSKLSPIDEKPYQGNTNTPTISNNVMISEANHTQTPPQISQQSEKRMSSNEPARTSSRSSSMTQDQITETKKINEKCQEREKKHKRKQMSILPPIDETPYQRNTNTPTISNNVMISEANHTQTPPQISLQSEKRMSSNEPARTSSRSSSMTQDQITGTKKINEKCQEREKKRKRKHMSKLSPIDETPYQRNTNTPTISNNVMISEANHTQTPPQISQQSEKRMSPMRNLSPIYETDRSRTPIISNNANNEITDMTLSPSENNELNPPKFTTPQIETVAVARSLEELPPTRTFQTQTDDFLMRENNLMIYMPRNGKSDDIINITYDEYKEVRNRDNVQKVLILYTSETKDAAFRAIQKLTDPAPKELKISPLTLDGSWLKNPDIFTFEKMTKCKFCVIRTRKIKVKLGNKVHPRVLTPPKLRKSNLCVDYGMFHIKSPKLKSKPLDAITEGHSFDVYLKNDDVYRKLARNDNKILPFVFEFREETKKHYFAIYSQKKHSHVCAEKTPFVRKSELHRNSTHIQLVSCKINKKSFQILLFSYSEDLYVEFPPDNDFFVINPEIASSSKDRIFLRLKKSEEGMFNYILINKETIKMIKIYGEYQCEHVVFSKGPKEGTNDSKVINGITPINYFLLHKFDKTYSEGKKITAYTEMEYSAFKYGCDSATLMKIQKMQHYHMKHPRKTEISAENLVPFKKKRKLIGSSNKKRDLQIDQNEDDNGIDYSSDESISQIPRKKPKKAKSASTIHRKKSKKTISSDGEDSSDESDCGNGDNFKKGGRTDPDSNEETEAPHSSNH